MRSITVYRIETDSGVVRRVVGALPGIEVVEPTAESEAAVTGEPDSPETPIVDDESGGLLAGVTPEDGLVERVTPETDLVDEETASLLKQYGLLGAGITFVLAGLASVGAWVYQRRRGSEAETPPPSTSFEPEPAVGETPAPSVAPAESDRESTVTESPDTDRDEPAGRVEGDRSEVEWTARDHSETRTEFDADTGAELAAEIPDEDEDITQSRPGESMDPAPLLGVAFIALSGALVRWLRGGDDEEQGPTG